MAPSRYPQRSGAPWWLVAVLGVVIAASLSFGIYHHYTMDKRIEALDAEKAKAEESREQIATKVETIRLEVDKLVRSLGPLMQ